jgi:hypothetical protein
MAFLTDQIPATGVNLTDLFHIVDPNDLSQNPAGSSYKATFQQVIGALTGGTSVMVLSTGIGSVERCGNNNDAIVITLLLVEVIVTYQVVLPQP